MATVPFEQLKVYQLAEKLSDEAWTIVLSWNNFAKDTVGKQLVRAADSIGRISRRMRASEFSGQSSFRANRPRLFE